MPVNVAQLGGFQQNIVNHFPKTRADLAFAVPVNQGKSREARIVQELLCANGFNVAVDGHFGDATAEAIGALQTREGLNASGVVDGPTQLALLAPLLRAADPSGPLPTYGATVIDIASRHVQERPVEVGGDNCGPWVRLYCRGQDGSAFRWCAGFVSFVLQQAAIASNIAPPLDYTLSCDNLAHDAKKKNLFVAGTGTRPAGITAPAVFLVRHTVDDWVHTGLVTSFGNGSIATVEGNTNQGGSANGFQACTRQRGYANIDFIRLV